MMLTFKVACCLGFGALVLGATGASAESQKSHVHGVGKLNIAVEGATAVVEIISPAESIYGFEHEASTAEDKKKRDTALDLLRGKAAEMVIFEPDRGCRIEVKKVEVVMETHDDDDHEKKEQENEHGGKEHSSDAHDKAEGEHHEEQAGEHSEVHAEFSVACEKPLKGSQVEIAIGKFFPELEKLEAQVLSETKQYGAEIGMEGRKLGL